MLNVLRLFIKGDVHTYERTRHKNTVGIEKYCHSVRCDNYMLMYQQEYNLEITRTNKLIDTKTTLNSYISKPITKTRIKGRKLAKVREMLQRRT